MLQIEEVEMVTLNYLDRSDKENTAGFEVLQSWMLPIGNAGI